MLKGIPILLLLICAGGVLSQGLGGVLGGGNISILPFNPLGFTRFIVLMISLPFRILGAVFGTILGLPFGSMGMGSQNSGEVSSEVSSGSGGGIFDIFLEIPRGVARFIEELFYFMRLLFDSIFGHLEGGAAKFAGDGTKSKKYREVRNTPVNKAKAG